MGKYKISEIARYRGLSPNGIVYLEKKGVLKSTRDESNGYRYYDENAFAALAVVNVYQQLGMSLDKAHTLYGSDLSAASHILEQNRLSLEKAYLHQMQISQKLQRNLETAQAHNGRFDIIQRPALWLLPISPPCPTVPEQKQQWQHWETINNQWDSQMPFVQHAVYYDWMKTSDGNPERCSIVEAEEAHALQLNDHNLVIKLPSCRCVRTVVLLPADQAFQEPVCSILSYLRACELTPSDLLVGRILYSYVQNNVLNSYIEFLAPISEN